MTTAQLQHFRVKGVNIEVVSNFNFFGSVINREGDCADEVKRRIMLGKKAMGGLNKIQKDKNISQVTKVKLVKAVVFPVAAYAIETCTMRKTERKRISAFEFWCWRRLLGRRKEPTCLLKNKLGQQFS